VSRVCALVVAIASCAVTASAQPPAARNVLTIHWGAQDYPTAAPVNKAIRDALTANATVPIEYFIE